MNADGRVAINELIAAVNAALIGCGDAFLSIIDPADGVLVQAGTVAVCDHAAGPTSIPTRPMCTWTAWTSSINWTRTTGRSAGDLVGVAAGEHTLTASVEVDGAAMGRASQFEAVALTNPDECEVLNNAECLLPYPSSRFEFPTRRRPTGFRLHLPASGLPKGNGPPVTPDPLNKVDGFNPMVQILMHFPQGVDLERSDASRCCRRAAAGSRPARRGSIRARTTDRSLDADSPSVLLDADTGERVLHWLELDAHADRQPRRARRSIMRPAVSLDARASLHRGHAQSEDRRRRRDRRRAGLRGAARQPRRPTSTPSSRAAPRWTACSRSLPTHGVAARRPGARLRLRRAERATAHRRDAVDARPGVRLARRPSRPIRTRRPSPSPTCSEYDCSAARRGRLAQRQRHLPEPALPHQRSQPARRRRSSTSMRTACRCRTASPTPTSASPFRAASCSRRARCRTRSCSATGCSAPARHDQLVPRPGRHASRRGPTSPARPTGAASRSPTLGWVVNDIIGVGESKLNNFAAPARPLRQGMLNTLVLARMMKRGTVQPRHRHIPDADRCAACSAGPTPRCTTTASVSAASWARGSRR